MIGEYCTENDIDPAISAGDWKSLQPILNGLEAGILLFCSKATAARLTYATRSGLD
jgi:hypothetical protein